MAGVVCICNTCVHPCVRPFPVALLWCTGRGPAPCAPPCDWLLGAPKPVPPLVICCACTPAASPSCVSRQSNQACQDHKPAAPGSMAEGRVSVDRSPAPRPADLPRCNTRAGGLLRRRCNVSVTTGGSGGEHSCWRDVKNRRLRARFQDCRPWCASARCGWVRRAATAASCTTTTCVLATSAANPGKLQSFGGAGPLLVGGLLLLLQAQVGLDPVEWLRQGAGMRCGWLGLAAA